MKSVWLFLSLALVTGQAIANQNQFELAGTGCDSLLGRTVKSITAGETPTPIWDLSKAVGPRGFLGTHPRPTAELQQAAKAQGIFYWGQSFAVFPTVEAARQHDEKFTGLEKIYYLISSEEIADLIQGSDPGSHSREQSKKAVQDRFQKIFSTAKAIAFRDYDANGVFFPKGAPAEMLELDKAELAQLIDPSEIALVTDDRGPRFGSSGWVFPKIRGVSILSEVFAVKVNGENFASEEVKNVMKEMIKLLKAGGKITFNTDVERSLNLVRDTMRVGETGERTTTSHYVDEEEYSLALEGLKSGRALISEVWLADGTLVGADLGTFAGNLYSADSPGYRSSIPGQILYGKMATLAYFARAYQSGLSFVDIQMVSRFSASLKGRYVGAEEGLRLFEEARDGAPVRVDTSRPFTLDDIKQINPKLKL